MAAAPRLPEDGEIEAAGAEAEFARNRLVKAIDESGNERLIRLMCEYLDASIHSQALLHAVLSAHNRL